MSSYIESSMLVPGIAKIYQTGTGVISGTVTVDSVATKCRILLYAENMYTDTIETAADGTYSFTGLLPSTYKLIIQTLAGSPTRRDKVEIVDVT